MIGRMSSNQIHQSGLDVILDAQARLARTQEELASGKRILNPSDDPVASAQIHNIKNHVEATLVNLVRRHASNHREVALSKVSNIENLLMRARELAVRGASDSLSTQDRDIIATEIDGLREQLIAAANSQSTNGDYIYGGFAVASAPYTDAGVNATYTGDAGAKSVNIAPGLTVETRVVGSELLGQGSATSGMLNAFEALSVLSAGLRGNATEAHTSLTHDGTAVTQDGAINIAMNALDSNLENVQSVRTDLGVRMNRVDEQQSLNENFNVRLQDTLSGLEDLDYTKAITEMNLQMVALEAAQKAYTKTQGLSLFNYL